MNGPTPLSPLTDPASLAKIPILLMPVHLPSTPMPSNIYNSYQNLIKRYQTLRGDELSRPLTSRNRQSTYGGNSYELPPNPRLRFFPPSTGNSISISRGSTTSHVHLSYSGNAPARHTYPLSLLRMAGFPLIVLGIAVEPDDKVEEQESKGYSVEEEQEGEGSGDITDISTPTAPTFNHHPQISLEQQVNPEQSFDETISSIFPSTSPFPLVKRLLVVPNRLPKSPSSPRKQSGHSSESRGNGKDKGYMRYAPLDGAESWIGRVLGEVVGELLGELGEIATALETPAGMRTLSSTLLPSLTSTLPHPELGNILASQRSTTPSDYPSRASTSTPTGIPHSQSLDHLNGMGISLTRALTPGGRPTSIQPPSLPPIQTSSISPSPQPQPVAASSNPFRRSTALSSPFTRTSSATSASSSTSNVPQVTTTKYTNATLSGVAGGRLMKLLGDMYLLAGLYGDAIKCYDDGAERCRSVGDVLWEGMAREGRAVAGIGEAWEGRDGSNLAQPFPSSPIPVEILSHYLSALACLSRSPLPYPPTILSPSPQAVSGSISFPAPSSSSNPSNVGTGEGLLAYLHTSLSLKIAHFLLLIWAAGGWGSIALSSLMTHSLPRNFIPPLQPHENIDHHLRRKRHRQLTILSTSSGISRQSIFAHAENALQPYHRAMTKTEQVILHNEAIWLSRCLDLPRKESSITRELIKRLAILVVEGREETKRANGSGPQGGFSHQKMKMPTISAENKSDEASSAAIGLGLGFSVPNQTVAVRRKESTEGNSGILGLFERAAQVMGIDLLSFGLSPESNGWNDQHHDDATDDDGGLTKPRFGWPELQVEFLKEGIAISESLPDHPSIIRLCLTALNNLNGYLNPQSQHMLNKMYPISLATVRRRGIEIGQVPWWIGEKVVLSVEIASLPPNKIPIEHSINEISPMKEGKKDPFLYNPRLKAAEAGKTVIVANEQIDVFVTVRNPFTFDLEIQDLSILTSGVPFITSPLPLTLPSNSVQTVRVTGQSPISGSMSIKGVSIRLNDGSSNDFLIPIVDGKAKLKLDKRKSKIKLDLSKVKRSGLDARFKSIENAKDPHAHAHARPHGLENDGDDKKWLECEVVPELPLAWIKKTSLTHGTVMLYNGETSTIRITLENSSSVPIDFIKLTFDDSTAREAQAIIQEGELTPEQAYEIEYDQMNKPVFTWDQKDGAGDKLEIGSGGKVNLDVRCLGKVGCTDGTIRIDYGYLNRTSSSSGEERPDNDSAPSSFYTRQITFPILFTVYHTIEAHSLDLIRLGSSSADLDAISRPSENGLVANGDISKLDRSSATSQINEDRLKNALEVENDNKHCLLALSVRNIYGVPFEITLERNDQDEDLVRCQRLVPPGATERMILPLPRRTIPQDLLSRPIPSLSERQYIVDKEKKSAGRIKKDRELFWYREELLNVVKATWTEPGSMRRGNLNIRDQLFSSALLDILRSDEVDITLSLQSEGDKVDVMDFVNLNVKVTNNFERPFRPFIHISPLPTSSTEQLWTEPSPTHQQPNQRNSFQPQPPTTTSKNVLFDGIASTILPLLSPGESVQWNVGVVFLALGKYGVRVAVEEVPSIDRTIEEDEEKEKQIWFSSVLDVIVK